MFRHTFASVAGGLGYSELTIAALLGHASRGVTQRYIHIDEPLRAAATRVSDQITLLLGDNTDPKEVRKSIRSFAEESDQDNAEPGDELSAGNGEDWLWLASR